MDKYIVPSSPPFFSTFCKNSNQDTRMPKPNRYYKLIFLMLFAISLTACANNGGQAQVGLLFPDLESERWKKEEAMLARLLNEKATK